MAEHGQASEWEEAEGVFQEGDPVYVQWPSGAENQVFCAARSREDKAVCTMPRSLDLV